MAHEKSPQDWSQAERLEAVIRCDGLNETDLSAYCRETGIYPHHVKAWKAAFVKADQTPVSKHAQKQLKAENKRLQKELNRKDKALSETAALLVLSKKCEAVWGVKADD